MEDDGVSRLTQEAGSAMTPKYAAPEQVTRRADHDGDRRLLARRAALRAAERAASLRRPRSKSSADFTRAIVEDEPLRLSAAAALEARRERGARRGAARDHARSAAARAARRPRHHPPQGAEEGSRRNATASVGGVCRRPAAVCRPPADQRAAGCGALSRRQVRAPSLARRDRGDDRHRSVLTTLIGVLHGAAGRRARSRAAAGGEGVAGQRAVDECADERRPVPHPGRRRSRRSATCSIRCGAHRDELGDQPEVQAEMFTVIGRTYERLGIYRQGAAAARAGARDRPPLVRPPSTCAWRRASTISAWCSGSSATSRRRSRCCRKPGDAAPAARQRAQGCRGHARRMGAHAERRSAATAEAEAPSREALAIRKAVFGDEHRETATSKSELGLAADRQRGDLAGAEPLLRENLATSERLLGPESSERRHIQRQPRRAAGVQGRTRGG